ncbi:MAG TPA: TolC family protein [Steroidobacteraceae bacterium]|nr:TolC family protein [Steroidobacteraceae bacterium]
MSPPPDYPDTARARRLVRGGTTLRLVLLGSLLGSLLGACAVYHPLPIAHTPDLRPRLQDLDAANIDLSRPLTAAQVGMLALLNDPDLRALRGAHELARAQLRQGSLLPNPTANITWEALLGGDGTGPAWAVSLTEDINALVTYRARVRAARSQADQVDADQLWQQWQVAQQARLLAVDLYWGAQALALSERERGIVASEIQAVQRAVQAGNLDYTALSPLLATQATLEQSLVSLQTAQLTAWQGLDALLGLEGDVRFELAPLAPAAAPADVERLIASLPQRRPDLVALQLGYRSADEGVRAAVLGQFPKFSLGPIWEQDTTNIRSGGPTASFDLPIFDRNQGQIAIARATRLQLHEQYQARLDAAVGQVRGLLALEQRTVDDVQQSQAASHTAEQLSRTAQEAYRRGNIDQRSLVEFQTAALERALATTTLQRTLAETRVSLAVDLGIGLPLTTLPDFAASKGS